MLRRFTLKWAITLKHRTEFEFQLSRETEKKSNQRQAKK